MALDPLSPVVYSYLGRVHAALDRTAEAVTSFGRMLEIAPDFAAGHLLMALAYSARGRLDEALAEIARENGAWYRLQGLAIIHHERGEHAQSDTAIRELVEKYSTHSAWQIATAYAARGDANATFEWLERCYAQRDSGLAMIQSSSYFRGLRGDPRWVPFMKKIGLADA